MKKIIQAFYAFALHFGLVLCLFSVLRILFYLFNLSSFPDAQLINFIGGIRFDWMTIIILYSPYLLLYPFLFDRKSKVLKFLFIFSTIIAIILNGIDFEYYKFTLKRTTFDLFSTKGLTNDIGNLIGSFIVDFWYIILICALFFIFIIKLYSRVSTLKMEPLKWQQRVLYAFILFIFYGIGFRGGLQHRPLNPLQASQYANNQNIPLVLNTPFTIIKSSYKQGLEEKKYFLEDELSTIYTPLQSFQIDSTPKKLNVVLLIVESLSKEYIGGLNSYEGYTPFFDSLMNNSLVFSNAFANGKKSIESLPAILSGIPTLMNESYVSGKYSGNQIESIASFLKQKGYQTSFYHGGENGTMGFKAYTQVAGIDEYFGRDEYPNKGDYDGKWGIFDEPFLQFCANDMSKKEQPFFASIFTLSSHHPYTIPEKHKGKFKEGPIPILQSIGYADYSLKQFFKTVKKETWFDETLFIIMADHTQHSYQKSYLNPLGFYRIPILFYSPKYISPKLDKRVVQQNDLFPSLIDFLGLDGEIVSFGNSFFSKDSSSFSISYLNELYQFVEGDYFLLFDGEKVVSFFNWKTDPLLKSNILQKDSNIVAIHEEKLKAIIQQYNNRLIRNQLVPR